MARVNAGLARAKDAIAKDGKVRPRLGRPNASPLKLAKARQELEKGVGIGKVATLVGLGVGTLQRLKREMRTS